MFRRKAPENEYAKLRTKQIEEFIKSNPAARPINADKSIYEVPIHTVYGRLTINVILGPTFPERPPVIQVTSRVVHIWVDKEMQISGHPKLQTSNWSVHAHLGNVVQEIVNEWARNPPTPQTFAQPTQPQPQPLPQQPLPSQSNPYQSPPPSSQQQQHNPYQLPPPQSQSSLPSHQCLPSTSSSSQQLPSQSQPAPAHRVSSGIMLSVPSAFDVLDTLTIQQLEVLDHDIEALEDFLYKLDAVQSVSVLRDDMYQQLEVVATANMSKKGEYESLKTDLNVLRSQLDTNQAVAEALATRQTTVLSKYSLKTLVSSLEKGVEEAEEVSDELRHHYEQMCGGANASDGSGVGAFTHYGLHGVVVDDDKNGGGGSGAERAAKDAHNRFVEMYLKQRQLTHERAAKKERLVEVYGRG